VYDLASAVTDISTKRFFKRHSVLLYQGEIPRMAYVVKDGLVKMYTINDAGEEQIVSFHGPNDHFPSTWIFDRSRTTLYYYETITDCEILTITKDALQEVMFKPELLEGTLNYYISNYASMLMRVTAMGQARAREKVMFTLYYLLFRYGVKQSADLYLINLPLTHQVLANLVGLTRETISNEISKLKRSKVISYKGRYYMIDKRKLERYIGEDSFLSLGIDQPTDAPTHSLG